MEKVGKMVLKTKPWKSGTNKLSLSRQFRAACKKLERLNLTFLRTRFIFRKGQGIYWKKFFARKGPLPLPNRFLRPTRVHLAPSRSRVGFLFLVFSENKRERGHASTSCAQANMWTSTHSHSQWAFRAQMPMLNEFCQVKTKLFKNVC